MPWKGQISFPVHLNGENMDPFFKKIFEEENTTMRPK